MQVYSRYNATWRAAPLALNERTMNVEVKREGAEAMANTVLIFASNPERLSHLEHCIGSYGEDTCIGVATIDELNHAIPMLNPACRAIIVDHEEPFVERLQLLQELRTALLETPVIVSGAPGLDNPHRVQIILRYFEYGAAGYVCVDDPCERLVEVLAEVTRGESFVEPPVALELLQRLVELRQRLKRADPYIFDSEPEELTPRQLEVLELVATGCTNQEIAEQLAISVGTVKNHVHAILEALKVSSREAAAQAYRAMRPAVITAETSAPTRPIFMTS